MKIDTHTEGLSAWGEAQLPRGPLLLNNSLLNKGTAYNQRERDALGLRGLLPPRVFSLDEQVHRVMGNLRRKSSVLEKYIFLTALQNRNETLFYRVVLEHTEEILPLIYTPTVGQACLEYGAIYRNPRGLYLTIEDKGRVAEVMRHWPQTGARMIVVTDGERILGLGDLGALGMGIPVGKLSLYTACAGVHPYYTLPITLDVGTDNTSLHEDPMYIGLNRKRVRGAEYNEFIEEFVTAVQEVFPKALLQWEDFGNHNAFHLLEHYRKRVCSFNDDIQGTASVALAGLLASGGLTGRSLRDERVLFLGAGEAGTGIADLITAACVADGMTEQQGRDRSWFVDSKGLVVASRAAGLASHKRPYAHPHEFVATLEEAVEKLRPTALIGVSGVPQTFTPAILKRMAEINERPVVFALSNPTSKAECSAEEAYTHTGGRAVFASGSPFPPVTLGDRTFLPGQGNNVYIFPGVGLGALVTEAIEVPDSMFLAAARTLAAMVGEDDLRVGRVYPPLTRIREVSLKIAVAVAEQAYDRGLARVPKPANLATFIRDRMFVPAYRDLA